MGRMYSSSRLELIQVRSYQLWERDGRQEGRSDEYWLRAEREIEAECRAAIDGEKTDLVLPLPRISRRPVRYTAEDLTRTAA